MYQRKNSHASTQTLKQPSETTARYTIPCMLCEKTCSSSEISSHLPRDVQEQKDLFSSPPQNHREATQKTSAMDSNFQTKINPRPPSNLQTIVC